MPILLGGSNKINEQQERLLSELVEKNCTGELKLLKTNFLPYGTAWNTNKNYTQGRSFSDWGASIPGIALSTTLEFPYSNVSGVAVSKDNARAFGKAIAYSIMDYLKTLE